MFEAKTQEDGELTILTVRGEVDLEVAPKLWSLIEKVIDDGRSLKVRLADVTYIDSSGLATLIRGLKHAQNKQVDYSLLEPSKRVLDVLELAQLDRLFSIESEA